jgi:hypothetical protein
MSNSCHSSPLPIVGSKGVGMRGHFGLPRLLRERDRWGDRCDYHWSHKPLLTIFRWRWNGLGRAVVVAP